MYTKTTSKSCRETASIRYKRQCSYQSCFVVSLTDIYMYVQMGNIWLKKINKNNYQIKHNHIASFLLHSCTCILSLYIIMLKELVFLSLKIFLCSYLECSKHTLFKNFNVHVVTHACKSCIK